MSEKICNGKDAVNENTVDENAIDEETNCKKNSNFILRESCKH